MKKFYYRFQWIGVVLAPLVMIFGPNLFGISTAWSSPVLPLLLGFGVFALLLAIAIITTQDAKNRNKHSLQVRVATLLEGSYVAILALLLTSGSRAVNSTPPVVSVLQDRGLGEMEVWAINDIVRIVLMCLIFLFLITALVSATTKRIERKHRTIEVIQRKDFGLEES